MTALRAFATAAALLLTTTACSAADTHPSEGPLPAETTTVEVTNNNWSDMVVYVVRSGMRHRLGMVTSMNTERLKLPRAVVSAGADLELLADPIGGRGGFNTGPIQVDRGEQIEFTIQNHLAISYYSVW